MAKPRAARPRTKRLTPSAYWEGRKAFDRTQRKKPRGPGITR